ncbi:MAG: PD40 domain-containing protein [Armatimonadetes bacterium]|nr:PD40 domain-containing protein [Armatimonadota bacterium]
MPRLLWSAAAIALASIAPAQELVKRTLSPSVSPDGKTIAFSWQGDIWTVPTQGGTARRLTVHPATEDNPVWTPDGKSIVFTSNRFGGNDVYVMTADGGGLRRLTFDSASEVPTSVSADGKTIYGQTNAWGRSNIFCVPMAGGDPIRLTTHPMETQFQPDVAADGKSLVYCSGGGTTSWQRPGQQGSATPHIWTAKLGVPLADMRKVTKTEFWDISPKFLGEKEFVVVSNRSGVPNIWRLGLDGKGKQVTHLTSGTVKSVSVSAAAHVAVFQHESEVWSTDLDTGAAAPVSIVAPDDSRRPAVETLTIASGLSEFAVSPNAKRILIEARGDIFLIPEAGGTTRQLTTSPAFDGSPAWLDDKTFLYVSAGTKAKRRLMKSDLDGHATVFYENDLDTTNPDVSPDGKWVAFHRGDREVCIMAVGGGEATVVATGNFSSTYSGNRQFNWSPDSQWLVTASANGRSDDVTLHKRDGKEHVLIGRLARASGAPQFLPNGKAVLGVSTEGLDFSEARDSDSALYIFDLVPAPTKFTEDDLDKLDEPAKKEDEKPVVKIVKRGLEDRKRQLAAGVSAFFVTGDSKTVIGVGRTGASRITVAGGPPRPLTGVSGLRKYVQGKGPKAYIVQAGKLFALTPTAEAPTPIPFSVKVKVDNRAEETALFEDAWRALRNLFYDRNMHGKDWDKIHDLFAGIVPYVTSRDDFYALMGEMVERLDSSHQGATSSDPYRPENPQSTGFLGVEWDWPSLSQGVYKVGRVIEGAPASLPDSELQVGDIVASIDGVAPGSGHTASELLNEKAGAKVKLLVKRGGKDLEILIKPAPAAMRAASNSNDWVDWNRAAVDKLSGGKLGYVYLAAMDAASLDKMLVSVRTELVGKKGLIVDVRYNGGGFTSHTILNLLREETWLKRTFRDVPGDWVSENIMRGDSVELPVACMTNWASFSNAEILSEGFKRMKIGPVIGERTGGAVIGTGAYGLWDGGGIRMPAIGVYAMDGENLEHNGRRPDFEVPFDPNAWAVGRDPQLEKAVEVMLKRIG